MQQYWVVGGEYIDTAFQNPSSGSEEWFGPYPSYGQAKDQWSKLAWGTVDEAHTRYRIESADPDEPPSCTD